MQGSNRHLVRVHEIDEDSVKTLGDLGFRRNVSGPENSIAVQLPYATFGALPVLFL